MVRHEVQSPPSAVAVTSLPIVLGGFDQLLSAVKGAVA
jgi:hypothetical protein